jgi:hypothetical protein
MKYADWQYAVRVPILIFKKRGVIRVKKLILLVIFFISIGSSAYSHVGHAMASQVEAGNTHISKKEAEAIALKKVKGQVVSIKLENDDGKEHYEVIIKSAGAVYEVEIDAKTGQVLEVEKEGSSRDGHDGDDDHEHDDDHDDHDDEHGDD